MRRFVFVVVLALVGGAIAMPPAQSATRAAAVRTCHGKTVTVVGERGNVVAGSRRDDVILSNGAAVVQAGDGDDTICVTGATHSVDGGPGADLVDTSAATNDYVRTTLGDGPDVLIGGATMDAVVAGRYGHPPGRSSTWIDSARDLVTTGAGNDYVTSGRYDKPNRDRVRLGAGDDGLGLDSTFAPDGVFAGGPGRDQVDLAARPDGHWVFDNRRHRATRNGLLSLRWRDFQDFRLPVRDRGTVRFLGGPGDEDVTIDGHVVGARLGGGTTRSPWPRTSRPAGTTAAPAGTGSRS